VIIFGVIATLAGLFPWSLFVRWPRRLGCFLRPDVQTHTELHRTCHWEVSAVLTLATWGRLIEVTRCNPACQLTVRPLASLYRSAWIDLVSAGHRFRSRPPWLDLVLADRQRFGSQSWIVPRYRSCPAADRVIPQLEPLAGDFNELSSVVGPKPADVIKAAGKHLVMEIEAATNQLIWHQHQSVVIDDLPVAMTLYP
jgi:hypothetical protein